MKRLLAFLAVLVMVFSVYAFAETTDGDDSNPEPIMAEEGDDSEPVPLEAEDEGDAINYEIPQISFS